MRFKTFLSGKLHRIRVTETRIDYIGSVGIDVDFMERAGIAPNEQVDIVNLDNGKRWTTYAIPAKRGSRIMALNGGGAYLGQRGNRLVVMSYVRSDEPVTPVCVFFGDDNDVLKVGTTEEHGTIHPDLK